MNFGDHIQCFRRVERRTLRKLNIDVERICTCQLDVELMIGLHPSLAIRHEIGEALTRPQLRIAKRKEDDESKTDKRIEPRTRDHAQGNPAA
jgi:hypothetical protein